MDTTQDRQAHFAKENDEPLRLDIVSDTICPWCYIGKQHLSKVIPALAAEGIRLSVDWKPFQLNPSMPVEGLERRAYRSAKFGSWEKSQALDAQVTEAGARAGLTFRHDLMAKTPNTLASHALIRLARQDGGEALQDRVVDALFAAYFTQGRDVGDRDVLADLASEAGMERGRVAAHLADPASVEAVAYEERLARGLGLNSVPSFVVEGHLLFSGAQPPAVMLRALGEAARRLRPPADRAAQLAEAGDPAHA